MNQCNRLIDVFLESLAEDKHEKSIAAIFSGTGDDGAKGVAMIKRAGGMVMVQSPESCLYPQMAESAIETGCADYILFPSEMPEIILKHVNPILKNANEIKRLKAI